MKFVICEYSDGSPIENGILVSTGVVGLIDKDNSFLTMAASYIGDKRPKDLEVGEALHSVQFGLCDSLSICDVYRVR